MYLWTRLAGLLCEVQAFEAQFKLAAELQRPVSFHCVRAFGHVMDMFQDYAHQYDQLVRAASDFLEKRRIDVLLIRKGKVKTTKPRDCCLQLS